MHETTPNPKPTLRALAFWLGGVVLLGLLLFVYRHLEVLANYGKESPLKPLLNELTGAFAAGLMFFPVRWLAGRLPLTRGAWPRRLPAYLLMMLGVAPAVTTLIWGLRLVIYPLAGLGPYDYGVMPLRYFMEIVRGIFLKGVGVSVLWPQMVAMAVYGVAVLGLSAARFRKRLD